MRRTEFRLPGSSFAARSRAGLYLVMLREEMPRFRNLTSVHGNGRSPIRTEPHFWGLLPDRRSSRRKGQESASATLQKPETPVGRAKTSSLAVSKRTQIATIAASGRSEECELAS